MQVEAAQLSAQLQRGLQPLYVVQGDEPLLVQEAADAVRATARAQGYTERSVHSVSGAHFDWSAVLAAGNALSLFADKQLVEIHIPTGKPGKDGASALEQIASAAAGNDSTLTLVLLPRLDKATQSSAWFEALQRHGVCVPILPVERTALPAWIAQRLARQNQRVAVGELGQRTLQLFADRVEGNLLAAHQEVQKLALLYPAGELSLEQVESAVGQVARYDVYKLSEAVLGGQLLRVQRMLQGLQAEGDAAVLVHMQLAQDIRALYSAHEAVAAGRPLLVVLREQRIWGVRERLFERVLPQLTAKRLATLLHAAQQVDGVVKGLKAPDWPHEPWQALQRLAFLLCSACMAR